MASRSEVYEALDSEREYQNKWNTSDSKGQHSFEEWFTYMLDYINEAQHLLSRDIKQNTHIAASQIMRKVTAMGVAAMEQHGALKRAK